MNKITSINQIADAVREEGHKARTDAGNLPGLYMLLSSRWHCEITKILNNRGYESRNFGHIESKLKSAYRDMRNYYENFPNETEARIKTLFTSTNPGYSPIIRDMLYQLAHHESKSKYPPQDGVALDGALEGPTPEWYSVSAN